MVKNEELPIGFSMELAKHLDALNRFSRLSDPEKRAVIERARQIKTKEEMRSFVASGF